ncbi:hypothetical protein [Streptomyces sp. NPDC019507]|uniref:hypothetical protein n=1 Tax=Streptomyces sp. NPDC019507 TaxID=3154689 RepID=UPI0033F8F0CB
MTPAVEITGALFIDCGDGFEIRKGDRAGQIVYRREPRARFECLRCRTTEGPVSGPADVREFVANVRTDHLTRCQPASQGAQAA